MTDTLILTPEAMAAPVIVNNVLYHETALVGSWIHEKMGVDIVGASGAAIPIAFGLVDPNSKSPNLSERLIAGCYFYNMVNLPDKKDIWLTAVMTEPSMQYRQAIKQVLAYPFGQLGLPRISAEIDMRNTKSIRQAEIMGFQLEGRKRFMGVGGGDYGVFGLYPDNCPFWRDAQ